MIMLKILMMNITLTMRLVMMSMEQLSSAQRLSTILSRLLDTFDDEKLENDEFSVEIIGNDTFEEVEVVGGGTGEKLSVERKSFSLLISTTGIELSS